MFHRSRLLSYYQQRWKNEPYSMIHNDNPFHHSFLEQKSAQLWSIDLGRSTFTDSLTHSTHRDYTAATDSLYKQHISLNIVQSRYQDILD